MQLNTMKQPGRTVSATEAKSRFGTMIDWATKDNREVLVESNGTPKVVIMSYDRYQEVSRAEEEKKRREALENIRSLRKAVQEQSTLTEAEAEEVADRFVREVIDEMFEEGKLTYKK